MLTFAPKISRLNLNCPKNKTLNVRTGRLQQFFLLRGKSVPSRTGQPPRMCALKQRRVHRGAYARSKSRGAPPRRPHLQGAPHCGSPSRGSLLRQHVSLRRHESPRDQHTAQVRRSGGQLQHRRELLRPARLRTFLQPDGLYAHRGRAHQTLDRHPRQRRHSPHQNAGKDGEQVRQKTPRLPRRVCHRHRREAAQGTLPLRTFRRVGRGTSEPFETQLFRHTHPA